MESAKVTKKVVKSAAKTQEVAPTPAPAPVETASAKKGKASTATPTPAPAVQTPVEPSPAKKSKTSAKASEAPSTVSSTPSTSVSAPTESVAATTEATATVAVHDELETLANDMIKMAKRFLELSRQAKKEHARQVKKAEQGSGRRRQRKADGESSHSNSVFLQPCKVSPALATFCGVAADTMISRTDATRKIAAYIKEHNLQNPENRREIRADATLTKLFTLGSEDKLNYFNLQRYIKPHFIKEVKA